MQHIPAQVFTRGSDRIQDGRARGGQNLSAAHPTESLEGGGTLRAASRLGVASSISVDRSVAVLTDHTASRRGCVGKSSAGATLAAYLFPSTGADEIDLSQVSLESLFKMGGAAAADMRKNGRNGRNLAVYNAVAIELADRKRVQLAEVAR